LRTFSWKRDETNFGGEGGEKDRTKRKLETLGGARKIIVGGPVCDVSIGERGIRQRRRKQKKCIRDKYSAEEEMANKFHNAGAKTRGGGVKNVRKWMKTKAVEW